MTEEEARTKWCPMESNLNLDRNCIASGCMMWVRDYKKGESHMDIAGPDIECGGHCGLVK